MNNIESKGVTFRYPNSTCFARANNVLSVSGVEPYSEVSLNIEVFDFIERLAINRKADSRGVCHIPLDGIFTSLFTEKRNPDIIADMRRYCKRAEMYVFYEKDGKKNNEFGPLSFNIINGAGGEIVEDDSNRELPTPNPNLFIFYPAFFMDKGEKQIMNINIGDDAERLSANTQMSFSRLDFGNATGRQVAGTYRDDEVGGLAYFDFDYPNADKDYGINIWSHESYGFVIVFITADYTNTSITAAIQGEIDNCTDGIFTRWRDRYGFLRYYRWSVETSADSSEIDNTYTMLDENLTPYDYSVRKIKKTFTLHSRFVNRATFEMCKTIIGGRDIQYYDVEQGKWRDCNVDSETVEDNGKNFKDMVIELYAKELTI